MGSTGDAPGYCALSTKRGTSMASPTLAGMAILLQEYLNMGYYPSGFPVAGDGFDPSGALLKNLLMHSGQAMSIITYDDGTQDSTVSYPSNLQGYGRVQLNKVVSFGPTGSLSDGSASIYLLGAAYASSNLYRCLPDPNTNALSHSFTITTSSESSQPPIRVSLAYTDKPGTANSAVILVNDLSLSLSDTCGGSHTYSPLSDSDPSLENFEMIVIDHPIPRYAI